MQLSKRLQAVAGFVSDGYSVADVGTDHGYIPIYLADGSRAKIIAMDINEGPLSRAAEHIIANRLEMLIETRISDGLKALKPGEVQSVILAGMGGSLVINILSARPEVTASIEEFILQPQSEMSKVREFLQENDFIVRAEEMILEDGKYYPILYVRHGQDQAYKPAELRYGRMLLQSSHPVLRRFIEREIAQQEQILLQLSDQKSKAAEFRKREVAAALMCSHEALERIAE